MKVYLRHFGMASFCIGLSTLGNYSLLAENPAISGKNQDSQNSAGIDYADKVPVTPSNWPSPRWPLRKDEGSEKRISDILSRMSVEQKVGQIIQADIASVTPAEARQYHLGSILNGGNSGPGGDEFAPPAKWLELADAFYDASMDTKEGAVRIPIMWGTDAVHGHSNVVGATIFPHNIGLGAARDPYLIERIGRATAEEIRATGMEWTFAPTVAVPQDFRWGRAYEGYSSDPQLVATYTRHMIRGLQGAPSKKSILKTHHVVASTKHFLADGGTADGRDQGDANISEMDLIRIHGAPYVPAIEEGVATIMTSFSSWRGEKIAGHKGLMTDVLKGRMNYQGMLVSDWNAHGQIAGCTNEVCPRAINAGLDMYMAPDSWKPLYNSLIQDVQAGRVTMARLDDAVRRVLRVKMRLGLFEAGRPSSRMLAGKWNMLGSASHRAIAREAVRKSLVLLKQENGILPIKPGSHILVTGDGTDDIARQSGGWTLTWQGTGTNNSHFPGGTSIWAGLDKAMRDAGGSAELSKDAQFRKKPDAAVVVFGETPYAEFQGDLKSLTLRKDLRGPYATMRALKAQGIPVIALMITGRPLVTNAELNVADAFVAAWLPGSEGGGIADMLVASASGKPKFDFTGKLPTAWPAVADALAGKAPLFPYGYGLRLADKPKSSWVMLDESSDAADADSSTIWYQRGQAAASWSMKITRPGETSTRITTMPVEGMKGDVRVTSTDHLVQEDARKIEARQGINAIELSTHEAIDISRETNGDVLLAFTMRLDAPLNGFSLVMDCGGQSCLATVPVDAKSLAPVGQWESYGIALKCFSTKGAVMNRITVPFQLQTTGAASYSISRVALDTNVNRKIECP